MHKPKHPLGGNQLQSGITVHRQRKGTGHIKPEHHQGNKLRPGLLRLPSGKRNNPTKYHQTNKNKEYRTKSTT